ncbi:mandelate racemase/muconate lactonizing enzyme family protein [Candidatus Latescibacterota bacterium]
MKRRVFLKKAGVAVAGAPFWMGFLTEDLWGRIPSGIKITEVKPIFVGSTVYVKIYTNKGVTGLGVSSLSSLDLALEGAVKDIGRLLIGRDPTNIEFLWQAAFRWPRQRGGSVSNAAISALEIALWDIMGKLLETPIYKLLGGSARDRVRLYDHSYAKTPEEMGEQVLKSKEEGFTAVRTGLAWTNFRVLKRPWNLKLAVRYIEAVRNAVGDDVDIIDDAHGLMTPVMALEYCNAIEPYRMMFIEDPVKEENMAGLKWVQDHTNVPIGIGESNYTKVGYFREIIFKHLANYVRPDVIWAGGISECKKIAAMAEANFIDVSLHGGFNPVSSLAMTHISASTPNCVLQECGTRLGRRRPQWQVDMFHGDDMVIVDGYAHLPEKSGLGCELDEELAAKHPYRPGTRPQMTTEDGAVMDW